MKQRPILFSTEMVQAIFAERKTQTRRVIKPQPEFKDNSGFNWKGYDYGLGFSEEGTNRNFAHVKCPYGIPGDVLWVRETYCPKYFDGNIHCYKADFNETAYEFVSEPKWKPSIHMPKDAARIWLRIKDVRVERLQDISGGECGSEGMQVTGLTLSSIEFHWDELKRQFKSLWQSINGEKSWNDNQWVWVIEFERIEKPINI